MNGGEAEKIAGVRRSELRDVLRRLPASEPIKLPGLIGVYYLILSYLILSAVCCQLWWRQQTTYRVL